MLGGCTGNLAGSMMVVTGVVPLCEKFDTIGPLAHSVEDCNHLLAAISGDAAADLGGASLELIRIGQDTIGQGVTLPLGPFTLADPKGFDAGRLRDLAQ